MELSVIIPTCPPREAKLRTLLSGIAASSRYQDCFEVVVVVDALDDRPLAVAEELLRGRRFRGSTQPPAGPGAARNRAIGQAQGQWLLFFDDDARVEPDTIPLHLERIRQDVEAKTAYLGRTDWPPELLVSPWAWLLATTSMVLFWDQIQAGRTYGFRHFCTSNLSVRTELVRAVGGFNAAFPYALHEDIELGWRLQRRFGMEVVPLLASRSIHDHALTPADYFRREHRCGEAAALARSINPEFHEAVWGWLGDAAAMQDMLQRLFTRSGREVRQLLEDWSAPAERRPSAGELRSTYLAHLPLKRLVFCQGYVGLPFDDLSGGPGAGVVEGPGRHDPALIGSAALMGDLERARI